MLACGGVVPAAIELLCEAVGMKLESFEVPEAVPMAAAETAAAPEPAATPLVQIAGTAPVPEPNDTKDGPKDDTKDDTEDGARDDTKTVWSTLTPAEQALHLRAQRTARVRVAQLRISESDALRNGTRGANIYGLLRQPIDAARDEFRRLYTSQSRTMVDYLHLEIMRSLAHDDVHLLGEDYPGPIV
jgi:hypothetical protein